MMTTPAVGARVISRPPERAERRRRRLLLLLLLFGSAVPSLVSTAISLSLFVDVAALDTYAFGATPVDVAVEPALLMTATHLLPGDSVDGEFTVRNAGTTSLRYAVQVTASDPDDRALREALTIRIWEAEGSCGAEPGVPFYVGALSGARIGDPAHGAQPGDRVLDPGESETVCVQLTLPRSTPNRFQLASTSVGFAVIAESVEVAS